MPRDYHKTGSDFRPLTAIMLRGQLESELGRAYEVSGTGHFVVAYPRGQKDQWAERFEDMYRSFVMYFSVRGFRLQQPPFPLVAIVWKSKDDFLRYSIRDGMKPSQGLLGYYSVTSNRVTLYDVGDGREFGRLAAELCHGDPRGRTPIGFQYRHSQPLFPAAAVGRRRAGNHV